MAAFGTVSSFMCMGILPACKSVCLSPTEGGSPGTGVTACRWWEMVMSPQAGARSQIPPLEKQPVLLIPELFLQTILCFDLCSR